MKKTTYVSIIACSLAILNLTPVCGASLNVQAQITVHVFNDSNKPVPNFKYGIGSFVIAAWNIPATTTNVEGSTDNNGYITLTVPTETHQVYYSALGANPGYYYDKGGEYFFNNVQNGKCQPWNPTVKVVVKPILNPIAMFAQAARLTIPAKSDPVGFDLEVGDWVAPYGKGTASDLIFTLSEKLPFVNPSQPYDVTNTLSFSNKGAGIQSVIGPPRNQGSTLRLPRFAPEDGYQPTLVQELALNGNNRLNGADSENQNYFFRVRTVLDESGKVKSALYGKIAGPISCGAQGYIEFTYYLNPTPNDRNMEFDPKKNLFKNLSDLQQVNAP